MSRSDGVAIIGMSCRFPGASTLEEFWAVLAQGMDTTAHGLAATDAARVGDGEQHPVAAFGILGGVDLFDRELFGLSEREASVLDPQQRLWLECAWRALEDAGHGDPGHLRTGVFAGCNRSTYLDDCIRLDPDLAERLRRNSSSESRQILNGNDKDFLASRTSFLMNLTGPSMSVQSACSTSLVAVATACRSLATRESDLCIAGGVSVVRTTDEARYVEAESIHSSDGVCRPFDAAADGAVFGDGAGAVILRRLEDAIAEGDRVYAVIRGWAINNDGREKAGFTAPSARGQARVVTTAQAMAGFDPETIGYVEAHGTGTRVGDPIEFAGLCEAFRHGRQSRGFCGLGSVKANIGHLDVAAGVAGLVKTALALHHQCIPGTPNFREPNPLLDLDASPFRVVTARRVWARGQRPRRAGVSSLGVGGTNCHIVLEEAPSSRKRSAHRSNGANVLAISARSAAALRELGRQHADTLERQSPDVEAYCYSASAGRRHFEYRLAVPALSREELLGNLSATRPEESEASTRDTRRRVSAGPRIGFLFPGQLSGFAGMARELFDSEDGFREAILRCERILEPHSDERLTDILFDVGRSPPLLDATRYGQPALFAFQYALARLWGQWGVVPDAVLGFSLGEYAAACIADVAALEEMLPLVATRGRLMDNLPVQGAMLSVLAPSGVVEELLDAASESANVSAFIGDETTVLSGSPEAIGAAERALTTLGYPTKRLSDRYAFHSAWLDPCLDGLRQAAGDVSWRQPSCLFASTLSGEIESDALTNADYWVRQAREPVAFAAGMGSLRQAGIDLYLEIGPDATLTELTERVDHPGSVRRISTLRRGIGDRAAISSALADVYEAGAKIDWEAVYANRGLARVPVPYYPFQRRSYWFGNGKPPTFPGAPDRAASHPLLGDRTANEESGNICFQATWSADSPAYMRDHRLFGRIVAPASSHLAMLMLAVETAFGANAYSLEDLVFTRPILVPETGGVNVRLEFETGDRERLPFQLAVEIPPDPHSASGNWRTCLTGELVVASARDGASPALAALGPEEITARYPRAIPGNHFYSDIWAQAEGTGPSFRRLDRLHIGAGEAIASISERGPDDSVEYMLHPGVVEACFQTLYAARRIETRADLAVGMRTLVPYTIRTVRISKPRSRVPRWCRARCLGGEGAAGGQEIVGDLAILGESGEPLAEIQGFHLRPLAEHTLSADADRATDHVYREVLERAIPAVPEKHPAPAARWLLVTDAQGAAKNLADRAAAMLSDAEVVTFDDDGRLPASLSATKTFAANRPPGANATADKRVGIIYLHTGPADDPEHSPTTVPDGAVRACRPFLDLCRTLDPGSGNAITLLVLSLDRQPPAGTTGVSPSCAPLWGLARVAMAEKPDLNLTLVELDGSETEDRLVRQILTETVATVPGQQIHYRGGIRYRTRLESDTPSDTEHLLRLGDDRSYLVTGRWGAQMEACVRWMLALGAGRVVLALTQGESEAHFPDDYAQGSATIVAVRADLSDGVACQGFLERVADATRPLGGVLFIPGIMDDGILEKQDWARFRDAVSSVVDAAWNLSVATAGQTLDFFTCFSSSAAVTGTPGQASYAAACSFLDALCRQLDSRGRRALSINWGPWASAGHWSILHAKQRHQLLERGWHPVETGVALALTARLVANRCGNLAVLPLDWQQAASGTRLASIASLAKTHSKSSAGARTGFAGTVEDPATVAPPGGSDRIIVRLVADAIGGAEAELEEGVPLIDLGLDSLMAVGLRNGLRRELAIEVPLMHLLGGATIGSLKALKAKRGEALPAKERHVRGVPSVVELGNCPVHKHSNPLFCLHWVSAYRPLARAMQPDCPVFGIWMEAQEELLALRERTVEHLASIYLERIRHQQARGPYRLAGSSFAGLLAFEIAQQLRAAGETVSLLALIDCNTPRVVASKLARVARVANRVGSEGMNYVTRGLKTRIRAMLSASATSSSEQPGASRVRRDFQRDAMSRYRPQPYPGKIILFVSGENSFNFERPADLGWIPYAKGGLLIHQLPGDHHGMLQGDGAKIMAKLLAPYWEI